MKNKTKELLDEIKNSKEVKDEATKPDEDNLDQFAAKDVSTMPRRERRSRLRYFKKHMIKHVANKPSIDVVSDDPAVQATNVDLVRAWATRYGILSRKILDLGGTQKDLKRAV